MDGTNSRLHPRHLTQIWRYYQVGIINTLVGFGLYAAFVRLGLNLYIAQIAAHLLGMAFNYATYSRHVFRDAAPSKRRFILAYGFNYLVSLASLFGASMFLCSPYLAGIAAIICASLINYFVLKYIVFIRRVA
jgi:putative flippase GtrA